MISAISVRLPSWSLLARPRPASIAVSGGTPPHSDNHRRTPPITAVHRHHIQIEPERRWESSRSAIGLGPRRLAGRPGREREVDPLKILGPCLGMHVALCGRDARVPEELLYEARVSVPGDEAAGSVAQRVEAQRAQSGGVACRLEPAAHGRRVEATAEARAEDVVLAGGVVAASPQPFQGLGLQHQVLLACVHPPKRGDVAGDVRCRGVHAAATRGWDLAVRAGSGCSSECATTDVATIFARGPAGAAAETNDVPSREEPSRFERMSASSRTRPRSVRTERAGGGPARTAGSLRPCR